MSNYRQPNYSHRRFINHIMQEMNTPDWDLIVEKYYKQIYAYAFQFSGNSADASDAVQQTFYKVFKSFKNNKEYPKNDTEIKYILYVAVKNTCLDKYRWWKRLLNFTHNYEQQSTVKPDGAEKILLQQVLKELPLRQKEVFILRHWHGFSTEETAKILKISTGSVKSHLSRAVEKVKQTYNEATK